MSDLEVRRQFLHILFGGGLMAIALALGPNTTLFYAASFLVGVLILHLKLTGVRLPVVDWILDRFERKSALFPGQGAIMYFAGALLSFSFTPFPFALATVAIVAFGDGFATLVGMHGKMKLPWNQKKTWEGFLAFVLSALGMSSLVVPLTWAVFYALLLGLIETLDLKTDDNLALPVAAVALYYVVGLPR